MELDSLNQLEERISKAIAHIEKLSEAKNRLEEKNKQLGERIAELEKMLKDKEKSLEICEKQAGRVSEKIKTKVESLLNKINSYEQGPA